MPNGELNGHVPQAAPQSHESRLAALEAEQATQGQWQATHGPMIAAMYEVIVGPANGSTPGQAEKNRDFDRRIARIEGAGRWLAGIGAAIATSLTAAWTAANVHIGNTPPPPPGHP